MISVMSIARFERFFRVTAGLDIDKNDLKRYSDFVNQKTYDLLLRGQATAKANGRDIIEPFDLPITKGLQESMHDFRDIDEEIELKSILECITTQPPLDLTTVWRPKRSFLASWGDSVWHSPVPSGSSIRR